MPPLRPALHKEAGLLLLEASDAAKAAGPDYAVEAAECTECAARLTRAFPPKHMLKTAADVVAYRCGRLLDYLHGAKQPRLPLPSSFPPIPIPMPVPTDHA